MKNSTLLMVGILVAVALLSVAVIVVTIQQASAQDTSFSFEQNKRTNVVTLQAVVIAVQ